MTFYNPKKTRTIPSVHFALNNRRVVREDVESEDEVRYADEMIPQITYEQAHGQSEVPKEE